MFKPSATIRKRTAPSLAKCPLCHRLLPTSLLPLHASTCLPKASPPPQANAFFCFREQPCLTAACTCPKRPLPSFNQTVALRNFQPSSRRDVIIHAPPSPPLPPSFYITFLPSSCPAARLTLPVLKSSLQKNIRLRRPFPASRVALALARKSDLQTLVRRLTVIIVEDAALTSSFPRLVWLLAALGRAFVPSPDDYRFVIAVVVATARGRVKDTLTSAHPLSGANKGGQPEGEAVLDALRVRASYGGMKGDVDMFRTAAAVWGERLRSGDVVWRERLGEGLGSSGVGDEFFAKGNVLRKGDIPFAALDFHCSSICDDICRIFVAKGDDSGVYQRFGRDCKDGIERLMWTHWSSKTTKTIGWENDGVKEVEIVHGGLDKMLWETEIEPLARMHNKAYLSKVGL